MSRPPLDVTTPVATLLEWSKKQVHQKSWLASFLKINKALLLISPKATSQARPIGFNHVIVETFLTSF